MATVLALAVVASGCAAGEDPAEPSASASASPTVSATSSPSPSPVDAAPAFDGDCAQVLTDGQVSELMDQEMAELPPRWTSGAVALSGGVECIWGSPDTYMLPHLEVLALPADLLDTVGGLPRRDPSCETDREPTICTMTSDAGGTWFAATVQGLSIDETLLAEIRDEIAVSAEAEQAPVAAERLADWWPLPACDELDAVANPGAVLGSTPAEQRPTSEDPDSLDGDVILQRAGTALRCGWEVSAEPDDDLEPGMVQLQIVPGAGETLEATAASEGAVEIDVTGSDGAVTVPDNNVWEGHNPALVARSGDNLLLLRSYLGLDPARLVPLAEQYLGFLDAG